MGSRFSSGLGIRLEDSYSKKRKAKMFLIIFTIQKQKVCINTDNITDISFIPNKGAFIHMNGNQEPIAISEDEASKITNKIGALGIHEPDRKY